MFTLGIILGFLPGLTWLFFYLKEDPKPEPRYLIFITFIAGLIAAVLSFIIQYLINEQLSGFKILPLKQDSALISIIFIFLLYAFIEEFIKFILTYFTIHQNKYFDEPIDAMIYMIVAALGFATLENIGVLTNNEIVKNSGLILVQASLNRFIGATLLHTITSGIIGYFWAISIRGFGYKKPLIWGLIIATLLHTVFNFSIIAYESMLITIIILLISGLFLLFDFEKLKYKKI